MPFSERIIGLIMWAQFIFAGLGIVTYLLSPNLLTVGQVTINIIGGCYTAYSLRSVRRTRTERESERVSYV